MSNSLVERIDAEVESHSLLKHPFYRMWSEGKLDIEDLAVYSQEYFQLVRAIPEMVGNVESQTINPATKVAIRENLREESEHIALWLKFASALGISSRELSDYSGASKTRKSVSELKALTRMSFEEAVAAMYAYESELPKISRSKIDGLKFYGMENSSDATEYFRVHEEADVRHAAAWRKMLRNAPKEKQEAALTGATRSLEAQNKLLDSVLTLC